MASTLGIPDSGNLVTMDFNKNTIDEDPDWIWLVAVLRFSHGHWTVAESSMGGEQRLSIGLSRLLNSQLLIIGVTLGMRRTKYGSHHLKKIGCRISTLPINPKIKKPPKQAWRCLPRDQLRMMMRPRSPTIP
ncbi:hypothetical protein M9H77_30958 [Catharanthus roseus]|uniref:Uncharacterized protein n=1 Tax=Catharanthus roseus TaxID=4058 RepID=A0ACB9ZZ51_CATRO|nr:hypothetical protein M9H77_30958 [Catharanthus roseus]